MFEMESTICLRREYEMSLRWFWAGLLEAEMDLGRARNESEMSLRCVAMSLILT